MARRERAFRSSVFSVTRKQRQVPKACRSSRSFASEFTAVRWARSASQVYPISAASSTS